VGDDGQRAGFGQHDGHGRRSPLRAAAVIWLTVIIGIVLLLAAGAAVVGKRASLRR
jgi:hypothetical protein